MFAAEEMANPFEADIDRLHMVMAGEFSLAPDIEVDSRRAQHLAEVILGNLPQAGREAALMRLGRRSAAP